MYQPTTGRACSCSPGEERDNCPHCEGTGREIDFCAIHEARKERKKRSRRQVLSVDCESEAREHPDAGAYCNKCGRELVDRIVEILTAN